MKDKITHSNINKPKMSKKIFSILFMVIMAVNFVACNGEPNNDTTIVKSSVTGLFTSLPLEEITVTVGGFSTTTNGAGDWEIELKAPLNNSYDVTFTNENLIVTRKITGVPLDVLKAGTLNPLPIELSEFNKHSSRIVTHADVSTYIDDILRKTNGTLMMVSVETTKMQIYDNGLLPHSKETCYSIMYNTIYTITQGVKNYPVEYVGVDYLSSTYVPNGIAYVKGDETIHGTNTRIEGTSVKASHTIPNRNTVAQFGDCVIMHEALCMLEFGSTSQSLYFALPSLTDPGLSSQNLTPIDLLLGKIWISREAGNTAPDVSPYSSKYSR